MKSCLVRIALAVIVAAIIFFLIDIILLCVLNDTLFGIFTDTWYDEPSIAVIKRAQAIVVFLVVGLLLVFRKQALGIVGRLMERLEQSLANYCDRSLPAGKRPTALVTAMLLFLGVIPILLNLCYASYLQHGDFFNWPLVHGGWVLISAFVLAGLTKRKAWAYYTLIAALTGNILLAGALAAQAALRLGEPFHGGHGFGALAAIGVFIFLILLLVYLGFCVPLTIYLWLKRKGLAPPGQADKTDQTEDG